mmetsp:Transcript_23181/g.33906  ORF Transcript_23181/g.33906 Transcript_23181/m.33906 type:complete len:133 (-) Transcript_23181:7-405(-)
MVPTTFLLIFSFGLALMNLSAWTCRINSRADLVLSSNGLNLMSTLLTYLNRCVEMSRVTFIVAACASRTEEIDGFCFEDISAKLGNKAEGGTMNYDGVLASFLFRMPVSGGVRCGDGDCVAIYSRIPQETVK